MAKNTIPDIKEYKPNDHLANERTYLAWVRTGVGIMAFGFVVVKFSLFIAQIGFVLDKPVKIHSHGYSKIIGIVLVLLGIGAILLGFIQYRLTEEELKRGTYHPRSWLTNMLTAVLMLISVLLVVYLVQSVNFQDYLTQ
ncbi:MAG: hypothetical protein BGO21_20215 [Dyadobacter sp. 50-39]|uniref:YidH family protein n=1 Tax=Dyadobacter sp. 50-39 TaxID=1895756 RepID=UPI00095B1DBB|nr:DUF202 domain-containing protein [Dyadobacter sp. 50-39]OJV13938.1 MAG: hypothetical protein BGO21_20215 [Dyadobacter sp. 50-39]